MSQEIRVPAKALYQRTLTVLWADGSSTVQDLGTALLPIPEAEEHQPTYVDRMDNDYTFWPGGEMCLECGEAWPCEVERERISSATR